MKTNTKQAMTSACRLMGMALTALTLQACSALGPGATPATDFYLLDGTSERASLPTPSTPPIKLVGPTLMVNPPAAAAGFDSPRIIYVRNSHQLEYFAHSEWVDPPARMLGPLLVTAIAHTGAFGAVVLSPSAATGDLRLDTEIIRLQHEFQTQPSRVRFTLRAILVDNKSRRVLAWREFDSYATATSEGPPGGVAAANRVVQTVLSDMATFCVEAMRTAAVEPAVAPSSLPPTVR